MLRFAALFALLLVACGKDPAATCSDIQAQMAEVAAGHASCTADSECHWANKVLGSGTCDVYYDDDVRDQMLALEQQYSDAGCTDHCDGPINMHPCVNGRCVPPSP